MDFQFSSFFMFKIEIEFKSLILIHLNLYANISIKSFNAQLSHLNYINENLVRKYHHSMHL